MKGWESRWPPMSKGRDRMTYALKALRGDFMDIQPQQDQGPLAQQAWEAAYT